MRALACLAGISLSSLGLVHSALAIPSVAVGLAPEADTGAAQKTRTCASAMAWGHTSTTTTDFRRLLDSESNPIVLRWSSQAEITCFGGDDADDGAFVLFHQEPNDRYMTSARLGCSSGGGSGCPWLDDSSGTSGIEGPMPVTLVLRGASKYRTVYPRLFNKTYYPFAPTTRRGRCTTVSNSTNVVGGPCASDAECGASSGVCAETVPPDGVFISFLVNDTNLYCQVEVCN